jgi:hypothetical protein
MSDSYLDWINQAMRSIYQDHSFLCMTDRITVTIGNTETSAVLPSDFKELQAERAPIYLQGQDGSLLPCYISREATERRLLTANQTIIVPTNPSTLFRDLPVWISYDANDAFLNMLYPSTGTSTFVIKCFVYLPKFSDDTDENYISRFYEEMVKAKVSSVAYEELRDPEWKDQEDLYHLRLKKAKADDLYRAQKGRITRMGS